MGAYTQELLINLSELGELDMRLGISVKGEHVHELSVVKVVPG